jgi:hypothetical protein
MCFSCLFTAYCLEIFSALITGFLYFIAVALLVVLKQWGLGVNFNQFRFLLPILISTSFKKLSDICVMVKTNKSDFNCFAILNFFYP